MKTLAEVLSAPVVPQQEVIRKFHWGHLNFNTQTIHLTKHVSYIEWYCDIIDLMDDFDMMSYGMPCYTDHNKLPMFNENWKIENSFAL